MVGELDIQTAGQKMVADFQGDKIVLRFDGLRSAKRIAGQPLPSTQLLGKVLSFSGHSVFAQIGDYRPIMLFPDPGWMVKWLSKPVKEMSNRSKA